MRKHGKIIHVLRFFLLTGAMVAGCNEPTDVEVDIAAIPSSSGRGQTQTVVIVSDGYPDDITPTVSVKPQAGIVITNAKRVRPGKVSFEIIVAQDAPLGKRVLSVAVGDVYGECEFLITEAVVIDTDATTDIGSDTVTFSMDSDTGTDSSTCGLEPTLEVRPASLVTGAESDISIFGKNIRFSDATSVTFPENSGLMVTSTQYMGTTLTDGEHLAIAIRADIDVPPGNIIGTLTSQFGAGVENAHFTIRVIQTAQMSAMPSSGYPGESVSVILQGTGTHFFGEAPATLVLVEPSSQGVGVNLDSVNSETELAATVYISADATPGEYQISAATILESGNIETLTAPFTVIDPATDTSGQNANTDGLRTGYCNDFVIEPALIPVGSFGRMLRFDAPNEISWNIDDHSVSLVGENNYFYLGESGETPDEKCHAGTSRDISCSIHVGLQAMPGDYEIHVTSNGVTSCGTLTVVGSDINSIEIPESYLPAYSMYTGTLDGDSNTVDLYEFNAPAGTTAVFHAYSLDRATLDPVLRLIDTSGSSWITFDDDETPLGIDARMAFHFAEGGNYYLALAPKLSDNYGNYQLYTYLLTHGNTTFETEVGNDSFDMAQVIPTPMGSVVHATIETTDDVDYYYFETTMPSAIQVAARRYGLSDEGFADTRITLYDSAQMELDAASAWYEIPSTADPRLFVADAGSFYVKVEAEEGASGFYALNIRPYIVINELDNSIDNDIPWIELQGVYNFDLTGYELCAFDSNGNALDASVPCAELTGFETDADGYVVIYSDDFSSNTLMLPDGPGAVSLRHEGTIVDAVQYGTVGANTFAEGSPANVGTQRTIGRGAGVDSNNNKLDFIYMATPTPGLPNDRTYQSAIPLYGEPVD